MILDVLKKYKFITQNIIKNIQQNNLDNLSDFIEQRQQCINQIQNLNLENKIIYNEYIKLNLKELDNKLNILLEKEKKDTLEGLKNLKKKHISNNRYNRSYVNSNHFNAKM